MENYFGIFMIFGRWNQRKRGATVPTTHQGAPGGAMRAQVSCALLEGRLGPSSGARKIIYGKNRVKISAQSELRISRNLRNSEGPDLGNGKLKRIEREIQSRRGSRPSTAMEDMDQRGNPPPI